MSECPEISVVFVTVGKEKEALSLARTLLEEKRVACVNMIPRIRSLYWWKGEICDEAEWLLVMKTPSSLFLGLQARIRELHSYEVPEIIAFPVAQGLPEYLQWVVEATRPAPKP